MTIEVKVPSLGESITSGILSSWQVKDGDIVERGQVIYELETDKITSEGQAEEAGKIVIKAAEGDEVEIGATIAEIDTSAAGEAPAPKAEASKEETTPEAVAPATNGTSPAAGQNDAVSPAVRRISAETGIDPKSLPGTGKDGRVTKADMLQAQNSQPATPQATSPTPAASSPAKDPSERQTRVKMTPLRRKIAQRLVGAQQEAALLTTFNEVDMSPIMKIRKQYQDKFVDKYGIKLGFMSFFVKAAVHALKEVPQINAQIEGDTIVQNHFYDIGVAVGGPKGLVVPVVRDCDQLNFSEIEQSISGYAKKAKAGTIGLEDMQGGVFTISNGGIYGSMLSTPIVNPPQSGILGMHNIQQRAVVVNGEIVARPMMYLAMSYDHRLVDGKEAVTFLVKIKEAIEDPTRLLFEI